MTNLIDWKLGKAAKRPLPKRKRAVRQPPLMARSWLAGSNSTGESLPIVLIGADTHVGSENNDSGDPNVRQVAAMNSMPGKIHPQGGTLGPITAVLTLGDFKHEDEESVDRAASYYMYSGADGVQAGVHRVLDGNHDQNDVRQLILQEYGSLNWGAKIGPVWFQAMTENYTAPSVTTPPTAAQINGPIAASVNARPLTEPVIFCVHRTLIDGSGYLAEWDPAALNALEVLANSRRTIGILFGHDHATYHGSWRGIRAFSPGSVRQNPDVPPYDSTYPDVFLVMRFSDGWYDVAAYRFGYASNPRVWSPDVWEWAERIYY